jgi:hypothetical protein
LENLENQDVIDSPVNSLKDSVIIEIIKWWEKKRWIYNVILVGFVIFLLFAFTNNPAQEIWERGHIIPMTILHLVLANLCYLLGWLPGVIFHYYFNTKGLADRSRWTLFFFGVLFSLLVTVLLMIVILDPFYTVII